MVWLSLCSCANGMEYRVSRIPNFQTSMFIGTLGAHVHLAGHPCKRLGAILLDAILQQRIGKEHWTLPPLRGRTHTDRHESSFSAN